MTKELCTILNEDGTFYGAFFDTSEPLPPNVFNQKYEGNFVKPKANVVNGNLEFYESATPEEIAQAELEKVPKMINGRQMKLQMLVDGISKNSVLAVINAIPDDFLRGKILIEWEEANFFERFNENLVALWLQLGKTEAELNQFFINASQL